MYYNYRLKLDMYLNKESINFAVNYHYFSNVNTIVYVVVVRDD